MLHPQQLECDTTDCTHWSEDGCTLPNSIKIQDHHCVDYEERPTVFLTIDVSGGVVQNVYINPDTPATAVTVFDMDDAKEEDDEVYAHIQSELEQVAKTHRKVY